MRRTDVIRAVVEAVDPDTPIVCNIGDPCKDLYAITDRDLNFYMLGSLGLASSIGLGVAVSIPELRGRKIVVIDGDGGVLMNLGTLATIGRYMPPGLILVIADNGSYGSTGGQPTATSTGCDLAMAARACSIREVVSTDNLVSFREAFGAAQRRNETSVVVARVVAEKSVSEIVPLTGPRIRDRFMDALK